MTRLLALSLFVLPAFAQQAPTEAMAIKSEPGKATAVQKVKASALVTGIDKATRTLTLKGSKGKVFELVAGDEVKNFDQVKVGDEVVVEYVQALAMELKKGGGTPVRTDSADAVRAKPGEKPGGAVGRQVTILADVIDVNPAKKTITLKGPKGNIVDVNVQNPDQFKVVKKGDQVEVVYVEALAIAVQAKKAPMK